ncbi:Htur_1727 family rSAM-partnered candidate RiPP [Natronoarchaeum rubrum]|uniref:Htur_1727 family rSAM-partnered candidate RiPP n=1 Tax=Natronoarchaeum rubrum TaxID=755311 RepID=UPI002111EB2F|nr:Htur_1727 family rSAM-partnered candidate RiPP [Natronoarchaeum rubrum]
MDDGSTQLEKSTRARVGEEPRGDPLPEWDVFVREDAESRSDSSSPSQAQESPGGVMRHVGSVSAPTPEKAHEHASRLFGWFADDVWVCESSDIHRFSTHSLGEPGEDAEAHSASSPHSQAREDATPESGTERRQHEWDE